MFHSHPVGFSSFSVDDLSALIELLFSLRFADLLFFVLFKLLYSCGSGEVCFKVMNVLNDIGAEMK